MYESMYEELGPQWAQDHAQEIFEQSYDAAVEQFVKERLRSFYDKHPAVAEPAIEALRYANALLAVFPKVAFTFAAIATELAWKDVLLKPMLAGLVTMDEFVESVMLVAVGKRTDFDRFKPVLSALLAHVVSHDWNAFQRPGSSTLLRGEIELS